MSFYSKVLVLAVVIVMAGCSSAPILNVRDTAITSATGKPLSKAEVRSAIVRAGSALGWQIKDEGADVLVGSIQLRKHTAVIAIPYSAQAYSINYRSSSNLDEHGGTIHKNYNGWVQNLTLGINAQLTGS